MDQRLDDASENNSEPRVDGRIKPSVRKLWKRYYSHPVYDLYLFNRMVSEEADQHMAVLEIGAGSGIGQQRHFVLKGKVARYVGVDLDPRVLENPYLDEGHIGDAAELPFEDATFDLVFHTMVAEHLPDPQRAMDSIARVLKPGGRLMFETPSRFYYPMLVSRLTPHAFHEFYIRRFASGRVSHDVFPTHYRMNDGPTIDLLARKAGLEVTVDFFAVPPGYLRFHPAAFLCGTLYERTVEHLFPPLRGKIIVRGRKPT